MQPPKFESLITPPWPSTKDNQTEFESILVRRERDGLSNFERNEKAEESLDHIAMLGYN